MKANNAVQDVKMTRRAAFGLALTAALPLTVGGPIPVAAAKPDPKTWMYAGNPARTGVFPGPGLDLTKDIVELWRIDGRQSGIFIDPCGVCDGIAYYLPVPDGISAEIRPLIAVDAHTGTELWRQDPPVTTPPTFFQGEPAIADGLLVMSTWTGLLVGLDARSGEQRWIFDLQGRTPEGRPAIVDDVVYISDEMSVNAIGVGTKEPEWLWKSPLGDGATTVVSATVSVGDDYVVVSSISPAPDFADYAKSTTIHVLRAADGTEAYRYQFRDIGESARFALENGMLYTQDSLDKEEFGWRSFFYSLTIDGTERWTSRKTPTEAAYPAVQGAFVCITGRSGVFCIDAATGEMLWNSLGSEALNPEIVLVDDVIYAGAAPPTPKVYVLNVADGSLLKTIDLPFDGGAQVVGFTDRILLVRSGVNMVAMANRT